MKTNENRTNEMAKWITQEGKFYRLTLNTEGKLFVDPELEAAADWFWVFHEGTFYCQEDGVFPEEDLVIKTMEGETSMNPIENVGFFLHSTAPVVGEMDADLVLLKYKSVLVMVVAIGSISRAIHTTLLTYTNDDEDFMKKNFIDMVRRCDSELALWLLVKQSVESDRDLARILTL